MYCTLMSLGKLADLSNLRCDCVDVLVLVLQRQAKLAK